MAEPIAEVVVSLPLRTTFDYRIPKALQAKAAVGSRAWVPFGHRRLLATIVRRSAKSNVRRLKAIESLLDEQPLLDEKMLELTRWISSTYQSGWGEAIALALPGALRHGKKPRPPKPAEPSEPPEPHPIPKLTAEQISALEPIQQEIEQRRHALFLLHGITGSGKTEVYLQAIQTALTQGRSSIVLVPEISLTPQTVQRFEGRFGREGVAVLHSGMLESQRFREWNRIRDRQAKVVVGARSAVFAPVQSLGLVVVDEEHETSYKQEDAPRYHAREVGIRRAEMEGAVVILGSATPSLEIYHRAISAPSVPFTLSLSKGEQETPIRLLQLKERIEEVPLPKVEIVDLRAEAATGRPGQIFSRPLEEALVQTHQKKEQGILFLNRRGFSTFVHCRRCGHVLRCADCQVSLTYHIATKKMICHSCHAATPAPNICPNCNGDYVRFRGTGTERVESELARLLPAASIARMDTDSTRVRGSHAEILNSFSRHEIDFLVGTQMIAKGLDFPRVTLVGVISADTALNLPDFRSSERTFHLLTQVAGRAGRGKMPGRVIVQTYAPHHYSIQAAKLHDFLGFYRQEIVIRKQLMLPPFSRLVNFTARSKKEATALELAQKVATLCRKEMDPSIQVVGPAPAPIARLRGFYRWQLLLKSPSFSLLQEPLPHILAKVYPPRGSYLAVDVDPL